MDYRVIRLTVTARSALATILVTECHATKPVIVRRSTPAQVIRVGSTFCTAIGQPVKGVGSTVFPAPQPAGDVQNVTAGQADAIASEILSNSGIQGATQQSTTL